MLGIVNPMTVNVVVVLGIMNQMIVNVVVDPMSLATAIAVSSGRCSIISSSLLSSDVVSSEVWLQSCASPTLLLLDSCTSPVP